MGSEQEEEKEEVTVEVEKEEKEKEKEVEKMDTLVRIARDVFLYLCHNGNEFHENIKEAILCGLIEPATGSAGRREKRTGGKRTR